jgi:hypothetical protein
MRWIAFVFVLALAAHAVRAETVSIGAAADNTLFEDAAGSLSNGAGQYFFAGNTEMVFKRRGLIRFDVAAMVPAGATITSATVQLTMSRGGSSPYAVTWHRALSAWGEGASHALNQEGTGAAAAPGDATWLNTFYPAAMWTTPGGDFAAVASTETLVGGPGVYAWPSTTAMVADVQDMLAHPGMNFGWEILCDETSVPSAKRFNTRENVDPGTWPVMVVEYQVPGVGGAAGVAVGLGIGVGRRRRRAAAARSVSRGI